MNPDHSLTDETTLTYATYAEALVAARSAPVDSAALYEAVNRYVDALIEEMAMTFANPAISKPRVRYALAAVMGTALGLAQTRYKQRRAAERQP